MVNRVPKHRMLLCIDDDGGAATMHCLLNIHGWIPVDSIFTF